MFTGTHQRKKKFIKKPEYCRVMKRSTLYLVATQRGNCMCDPFGDKLIFVVVTWSTVQDSIVIKGCQ